ncbi:MAG TPA: transposase [Sulfolobales archaeon]|nr:transposase [Sulfolobales archaeon]
MTDSITKTLKFKLTPLSRLDRGRAFKLLRIYNAIVSKAQAIVNANDVKSLKRAHKLCYEPLRREFQDLHNKYVQEAYKRALQNYKSYIKKLKEWRKDPSKRKPSPPNPKKNNIIDLHIDVFKITDLDGFRKLRIALGENEYMEFLVIGYEYAEKELNGATIGNSKLMIKGDEIYLLLTIRKHVEVEEHRSKLVIDINENNVSCLLVDLDRKQAILFRMDHDIKDIRVRYRLIRMGIQKKLKNEAEKLLNKYGSRERHRVDDRLKKIAKRLADIAEKVGADIVVEDLEIKRRKGGRKSLKARELNYRLNSFPYRKLLNHIEIEFSERGLKTHKISPEWSSLECPACHNRDRENRINTEIFRCTNADSHLMLTMWLP